MLKPYHLLTEHTTNTKIDWKNGMAKLCWIYIHLLMGQIIRLPQCYILENNGTYHLYSNYTADQCLCFCLELTLLKLEILR